MGDKPKLVSREQSTEGLVCLSEMFTLSPGSEEAMEDFDLENDSIRFDGNMDAGLEGRDPRSGLLNPAAGLARDPWIECLGSENLDRKKKITLFLSLMSN